MDPKEQLEALSLKQVEAINNLYYKLDKELRLYQQHQQAIALMEANMVEAKLGIHEQEATEEPIVALRDKKEKLVQAFRWSVYDCANRLRQMSEQARKLQVKEEVET